MQNSIHGPLLLSVESGAPHVALPADATESCVDGYPIVLIACPFVDGCSGKELLAGYRIRRKSITSHSKTPSDSGMRQLNSPLLVTALPGAKPFASLTLIWILMQAGWSHADELIESTPLAARWILHPLPST